MKNPVAVSRKHTPALYQKMQHAIAECYSVDDCQNIANQAGAIAAYYKQIKDDESERQFIQIKIRAWRRVGEILATANVDKAKCLQEDSNAFNMAEYIRQVRKSFKGNKIVEALSESAMRQAFKLFEISEDYFEKNIGDFLSIAHLIQGFANFQRQEWEKTPDGKDELKRKRAHEMKLAQQRAINEQKWAQQEAEAFKQQQEQMKDVQGLLSARDAAFEEVGITLDRRDREQMHQIVFLIKKTVHKILRQAAFDNQITMQSILRAGLMMWFVAHGYDVPPNEMQLPLRDKDHSHRGFKRE